jgi:7-cyano-7-deazaguanine synthase
VGRTPPLACTGQSTRAATIEIHAVTFNYNQRHSAELEAAEIIASRAGVASHEIIDLGPILKGTSPLVSDNELEQYADMNSLPGGLEKTFVPMRNQLFLTLAANRAYVLGCRTLITGVCQEDFGGYPDCRRVFIDAVQLACNEGTFTGRDGAVGNLNIQTPLMDLTKAQSVDLAMRLPGCYEALAYSHTSYDGAYPPTGNDHATLLRAKGFVEAGVPDPLVLRAVRRRPHAAHLTRATTRPKRSSAVLRHLQVRRQTSRDRGPCPEEGLEEVTKVVSQAEIQIEAGALRRRSSQRAQRNR